MTPLQIVYLFFLVLILIMSTIFILKWPSRIKSENSPPKGMTKPKIDLLLNVLIINIWVPYVISEIIQLVKPKKDKNQTIADYINSNSLFSQSKSKSFKETKDDINGKKFKKQLKKTDFSHCDFAFLYELLFLVCYGKLEPKRSDEYKKNKINKDRAEYYLQEIKESRNALSHDKAKAENEELAEKIKSTYVPGLISTLCKSYRLQSKIKTTLRKECDDKFEEIESNLVQDQEYRSKSIGTLLTNEYLAKLKSKCRNKSEIDFDDFINVTLKNVNTKERFNCTEIAEHLAAKFSVLYGIFGSGKSTLLWKIVCSILNEDNENYDCFSNSFKKFKLPIYIPCQSVKYDNMSMADFIKSNLPDYLASFSNKEVLDTVRSIDGLLFLIDDVSEQPHSPLVTEVVKMCKDIPSSSCIISARFTDNINELLGHPEPLIFESFMIESISDLNTQILFLKRYGRKVKSHEQDVQCIVKCFKNLKEPLRLIYQSPAILGTLVLKEEVYGKMDSDIDILDEVFKFIELSIENMLCNKFIADREMTSSDIVSTLIEFSVKHIKKDTNFINEIDFIDLRDKLKQFCPGSEHILSIILLIDISLKDGEDRIFYFHKPLQEYFIVKKILLRNELDESSGMNLTMQMLKEDLQLNELNDNKDVILKRYGNILRLLMLKLLSEGKFDKISKAMTELMKNIIQPDLEYALKLIIDMEYHKLILKIFTNSLDLNSIITVCNPEYLFALGHILFEKNQIEHNAKLLNVHLLESYETFFVFTPKHSFSISAMLTYGNCHIDSFIGCVDWGIIDALKTLLVESSLPIYISVSSLKESDLMRLNGIIRVIDLRVKYGVGYSDSDHFILPMSQDGVPPIVRISDVPANGLENVEAMICTLLPSGCHTSFSRLLLVRCSLTLSQVKELLKKLHKKGIRTLSDVTEVLPIRDSQECYPCSRKHTEEEKDSCYELKLVDSEDLDLPDLEDFPSDDSDSS